MSSFAKYIQILGKGRNGMRSLTSEEAYEAMKQITCYDIEPEQLGAFLMLMRVKEETAEEVEGFTRAIRESLPLDNLVVSPSIDWAAYAGKKRHLPWFLLAALVLAQNGHSVFMHGLKRDDERIYVPQALEALGIRRAGSISDAQNQILDYGFSFLPINVLSPLTSELIATRDLFGLRPPLNTVARMLNPLSAKLTLMGVFHPNFAEIHQQACKLLGQENALICKGEGGEFERIPDRDVTLNGLSNKNPWTEVWNKTRKPGSIIKPETLDLRHFVRVWQGEAEDQYGLEAVTGTLALVIRALGIEHDADKCQMVAMQWWQNRLNSEKQWDKVS